MLEDDDGPSVGSQIRFIVLSLRIDYNEALVVARLFARLLSSGAAPLGLSDAPLGSQWNALMHHLGMAMVRFATLV